MPPTGRRNGWRIGSHLVMDDLGGHTYWVEDTGETYYGQLVDRDLIGEEAREHPQLKVRPLRDPYPIKDPRPEAAVSVAMGVLDANVVAGVVLPRGAATHLFNSNQVAIEAPIPMEIVADGASAMAQTSAHAFVVR